MAALVCREQNAHAWYIVSILMNNKLQLLFTLGSKWALDSRIVSKGARPQPVYY